VPLNYSAADLAAGFKFMLCSPLKADKISSDPDFNEPELGARPQIRIRQLRDA